MLYFTYLPRSSPWTDLHQIWYRSSSPRHNYVCKILYRSVQRFRFYSESKFAILHWLIRSQLTQCSRYRAACDQSHCYTIAWDRLSNQFLFVCVCMYVCTYVCICGHAYASHFSTNLHEISQEPLRSKMKELFRLGSKSEKMPSLILTPKKTQKIIPPR